MCWSGPNRLSVQLSALWFTFSARTEKLLRLRLFVLCCVGLQARCGWSVPGAFSGKGRMWGPLLWSQSQATARTAGWNVVSSALCGLEGSQPGHCCPASVHQHQEAGHHPEWLWTQTGKEYSIYIGTVYNIESLFLIQIHEGFSHYTITWTVDIYLTSRLED